jgi:hypothetical protein
MKKQVNRIQLLFTLMSILLLSSCHDPRIYRDEYPELNSLAVESIIGAMSDEMNRVKVLDEDDYGRVLFSFMGPTGLWANFDNPHVLAVAISQRSDTQFVYYYDAKNYIAIVLDADNTDTLDGDLSDYFTDESIKELKLLNDWNQPIDEYHLFRISVNRKKVCDVTRQEIRRYDDLFDVELNLSYIDCYGVDRNGLRLVNVKSNRIEQSVFDRKSFLLILNEKHELISEKAILDITTGIDLNEIYQFKLDWGWSFTYK